MVIGIIGAGKVGCSMGKYLKERGQALAGYFSRQKKNADSAAAFTGTKSFQTLEELVHASGILMIAAGDDSIARVWDCVVHLPIQGKMVCHFSGSLSSAVFSGRDRFGVSACSIHPMYAFNDKFTSYQKLNTAGFTMEGDREALAVMKPVIEHMGNRVYVISPDKKLRYHAAASMLSNMMVGLYDMGLAMLSDCGLGREEAARLAAPLVQGNIRNLLDTSPEQALTGPVERNDIGTVKEHLTVLTEDEREVYRILGQVLTEIADRKNPERDYRELKHILEEKR